jgi:transposase
MVAPFNRNGVPCLMDNTSDAPPKCILGGIDLHSNNLVVALMDRDGSRLAHRRLPCDLAQILIWLAPWKDRLDCLTVESTFNWYWLVDGLRDAGYHIRLANPAKFQPYTGLKHSDDLTDAWFLADLLRLNLLPEAYQYDRQLRPIRDLLRRRLLLVRQRTALYLSLKNLYCRTHGAKLPLSRLKAWTAAAAEGSFDHPADKLAAVEENHVIKALTKSITAIEVAVLESVAPRPEYERVRSLPGVGLILGMTIVMEIGDILRFARPENLASYARCVSAVRHSNQKRKAENNRKCGNGYLGWAMVEAAHMAARSDPPARMYYQRKSATTHPAVATKALACKLCKALWHVWHDGVAYDPVKAFGPAAAAIER